MPKPVLSDSLFNADDVATAVLAEANLQIANSNLGVTDISSSFTPASGFSLDYPCKAFHFMGFIFVQFGLGISSTPSNGATLVTIGDSSYYPSYNVVATSVSHQAETVSQVEISSGTSLIKLGTIHNAGDAYYRIRCNFFYKV